MNLNEKLKTDGEILKFGYRGCRERKSRVGRRK